MISYLKDPRIESAGPGLQLEIYNLIIVSWSFPGRIFKCRWFSLYVVLKIWPRTASISFLKISTPLKLRLRWLIFFVKSTKRTMIYLSSNLSMESSIVMPFCIFLEVSTVRNNSKIRQLLLWSSRQAYGRKFTIWKSWIALTPL